jgi:hypothetical protein
MQLLLPMPRLIAAVSAILRADRDGLALKAHGELIFQLEEPG